MGVEFKNKKVAILGWGINGVDAAKYLLSQGAKLTILDRNEKLEICEIDTKDVDIVLGPHYLLNLEIFDYVFRAPGVYRYLPELINAEKEGVVITSAVNLFFDLCPGKIIGVTGTKGKGTTSTLIYEILKKAGKDAYLAGNIGEPILELLPKLSDESLVVLELSSFQLIDLGKSPHVGVVLNITLDHMDWHKDPDEYIDAKKSIVSYQTPADFAVINYDYDSSRNFTTLTKGEVINFSTKTEIKGSYVKEGKLYLNIKGKKELLGKTSELLLRGNHNWENITAAVCAAYLAGADLASIKKTVFSFPGLEHRLELVGEIGGVKYYNDSFSTNPQTTIAAVNSFEEPITLILGGSDKGLDYSQMGLVISKRKNIINIVLIGDIAGVIKTALAKAGYNNNIYELGKSPMVDIVKKCAKVTPAGGVVVLSPATASFDMFANYKDRGIKFKESVKNLKHHV